MRGGCPEETLSYNPNMYSPVVQWDTVKLMMIFQCILGLQIQSIDFINAFALEYIPSGGPVFTGLPRYFKSGG